jgi:hypothetical protein
MRRSISCLRRGHLPHTLVYIAVTPAVTRLRSLQDTSCHRRITICTPLAKDLYSGDLLYLTNNPYLIREVVEDLQLDSRNAFGYSVPG